ncbi:DUF6586 family protein [Atopomonas sediminilitoris]|uniref:DUF6586 family protein n=1 Tax=Atopomonas sediminilitoris TaxID=2919919 RepID=UPI001F4D95E8|nr:DUF6586 family protein [Atopomonas sediminilitoris]MCJ8169214.1 PasA protein [Atopomonas sediminilitoris]
MANEPYTRTNQRIYFTGLVLDQWRQSDRGTPAIQPALEQCLRESALFHLYGATLALGQEIASFYRLPIANEVRVDRLISRTSLQQHPGAELAELVEIMEAEHSWLKALVQHYDALHYPVQPSALSKIDPAVNLISRSGEQVEDVPLSRDTLSEWRDQLKQLVLRLREGLNEW